MDTIVCIKQVPEITEVKIDQKTHTLIRDGVPSILNPFDEFAVEEAVKIKEKYGGEITVITMGPSQAKDALFKCLAMGADKAILLTDRKFAGADTLATAYTLSCVIKTLKFDLILCGKQAIDGDTAQVGPELAEFLKIPQITCIKKLEILEDKKAIRAWRETDEGYEVIESKLPVLLTAIKGLNQPRIPGIKGIMAAKKKPIKIITADELEADPERLGLNGSPTQVINIFSPERKSKGTIIKEEESVASLKLFQILKEKL